MTKMVAMSIYGKKLEKSSPEAEVMSYVLETWHFNFWT